MKQASDGGKDPGWDPALRQDQPWLIGCTNYRLGMGRLSTQAGAAGFRGNLFLVATNKTPAMFAGVIEAGLSAVGRGRWRR
jgi:hypothetical protein